MMGAILLRIVRAGSREVPTMVSFLFVADDRGRGIAMSEELLIVTPDHQSRRVTVEDKEISLGRAHTNDLCYPEDASLSRKHMVPATRTRRDLRRGHGKPRTARCSTARA